MELPRLQTLYEKFNDQGLEIIAVDATHDTERAKKLIETKGLSFTLLEDHEEDGIVSEVFGVHSFPTSFLIDREGRVMYFHLGFDEGDEVEMEEQIKTLL